MNNFGKSVYKLLLLLTVIIIAAGPKHLLSQNNSFYKYKMDDSQKALYKQLGESMIRQFFEDTPNSLQKAQDSTKMYLTHQMLSYYSSLIRSNQIDTTLFISFLGSDTSNLMVDGVLLSEIPETLKNAALVNRAKELITKNAMKYSNVEPAAITQFKAMFYSSNDCSYTPEISSVFLSPVFASQSKEENKTLTVSYMSPQAYIDSLINWVLLFNETAFYFLPASKELSGDDAWKYDNDMFFKIHTTFFIHGKYHPYQLKLAEDTAEIVPQFLRDNTKFFDTFSTKSIASLTFLFYVNINDRENIQLCNITPGTVLDINEIIPDKIKRCLKPSNKSYLSVSGSVNYGNINLSDAPEGLKYEIEAKAGYGVQLGYSYFFRDGLLPYSWGLGTGASFMVFHNDLVYNEYQNETQLDDEFFMRNVLGMDIRQQNTLKAIQVPLTFRFKYKFNDSKFNLIAELGASYSYLLSEEYELARTGNIQYSGEYSVYFPETNSSETYIIEDVPDYGLLKTTSLSMANSEYAMSQHYFSGIAGLTGQYALSDNFFLHWGLNYNYGFLALDSKPEESFFLSYQDGEINNLVHYSESITSGSFGVQIGLTFNLK